MRLFSFIFAIVFFIARSYAGEIVVQGPDAATGLIKAGKTESPGVVDGGKVTFSNLKGRVPYDVRIDLKDGTTLQGFNLNWYNDELVPADTGEMNDDDRSQIDEILKIPSFYDRTELIKLKGDHVRAVGLVQLVREKDFHASGGNVIWRMEIYYFKNQAGGWEKVVQQNKVLRCERFKNPDEFKSVTSKIKWLEELGGIVLRNDADKKTIEISTEQAKN